MLGYSGIKRTLERVLNCQILNTNLKIIYMNMKTENECGYFYYKEQLKLLFYIFAKLDKVDIKRRLDIMEKMWSENSLCKDIQQRLLDLSEALLKNEIEKADDLQKGLMVDYAPDCSPWMSGIRHLIHHELHRSDDTEKQE